MPEHDVDYNGTERRLFPEWFDFFRKEVLEPRLVQVERAHADLKKSIDKVAESTQRIELRQEKAADASQILADYAEKADKVTNNKWARAGAIALVLSPIVATAALVWQHFAK